MRGPIVYVLALVTICLLTLTACGGGGGGGGGPAANPLARAEAINFVGTFTGDTDWGHIDQSADQHLLAADMAFLVREMEVANMTPGRLFLSEDLQHTATLTGGCDGSFEVTVPAGGTMLASAGSGTFANYCIDSSDAPLSGAEISPYVLVSGKATWDIAWDVDSDIPGTFGYSELEGVVLQWRGEEFTLNSRVEFEGANRYFVMDVTLNATTYRFYHVFIPDTPAAPGHVFWAGVHPEFGKFRIDQDIYDSDDALLSYSGADDFPLCLGPVNGAQTVSEPKHGATFQFRASSDCRTYALTGQDSTGAPIDSQGHKWLDLLIDES